MLLGVTIVQAGVPLALLAWLAFVPPRSRLAWGTAAVATMAWLVATRLAGLWLLLPRSFPLLLFIPLAAALMARGAQLGHYGYRPRTASGWMELGVLVLLLVAPIMLTASAMAGRQEPDSEIADLTFPLRDGEYYVANGGTTPLLNPHLSTLTAPRATAFRGQSFATDIVKADGDIFGDVVYAPCAGAVLRSEDGAPDMPIGTRDPSRMPGNHVLVECAGRHVLLAHLQRGSVRVQPGESVTPETPLGRVGNSGNSDAPHLHVHAQLPAGDPSTFMAAQPVYARFDGLFLARNDLVQAPVRGATRPGSWTPTFMMYAQLGSCIAALLMLAVTLRSPFAGRLLFVLLFGWAAQVNMRLALTTPEVYLDYAELAPVQLYRWFILGVFARHTATIVALIAAGQAAIALLLLFRGTARRMGLVGAVLFLVAIAPLGIGSGFPATLIMAMAIAWLMRHQDDPVLVRSFTPPLADLHS